MSITTYIYEDLKVRLESGRELPAPLTLEALSAHYRVSFSPIRIAVSMLVDEGLIVKGENRRLAAAKNLSSVSSRQQDSELPSPPKDMYEVIANDFVLLSLKGKALDLREEATAQKYGISRSSLRIIFNRLAGAGLIEHIPRCGWRLRPFRQEDLHAFLEIRELLELKALELSQGHLVKADLERILAGNVFPSTPEESPKIDNSLHEYFIEKAGNFYIQDFFQRHGKYYDVLFHWEDKDRQASLDTVEQHHAILKALLKNDWKEAKKALSHHIHNNHPVLNSLPAPSED